MLLACCFREPKPKHEKKNKTKNGKRLPSAASDEVGRLSLVVKVTF